LNLMEVILAQESVVPVRPPRLFASTSTLPSTAE